MISLKVNIVIVLVLNVEMEVVAKLQVMVDQRRVVVQVSFKTPGMVIKKMVVV